LAASNGYLNIVHFLLEETKALESLENTNHDKNTALLLSAHYGRLNAVRYLVSHGADPDFENNDGQTAKTIPFSLKVRDSAFRVTRSQLVECISQGIIDKKERQDEEDIENNGKNQITAYVKDKKLKEGPWINYSIRQKVVKGIFEEQKESIIRFRKGQRYLQDAIREISRMQYEAAFRYCQIAQRALYKRSKLQQEHDLMKRVNQILEKSQDLKIKLEEARNDSLGKFGVEEAVKYKALAEQYMKQKEYTEAADCYEICSKLDPANADDYKKQKDNAEIKSKEMAKSKSHKSREDKRDFCQPPQCLVRVFDKEKSLI